MKAFSDFRTKNFRPGVAGFFLIKGSISDSGKKISIKIVKLPGLLPRPSEGQVWFTTSKKRGGSLEGW